MTDEMFDFVHTYLSEFFLGSVVHPDLGLKHHIGTVNSFHPWSPSHLALVDQHKGVGAIGPNLGPPSNS